MQNEFEMKTYKLQQLLKSIQLLTNERTNNEEQDDISKSNMNEIKMKLLKPFATISSYLLIGKVC